MIRVSNPTHQHQRANLPDRRFVDVAPGEERVLAGDARAAYVVNARFGAALLRRGETPPRGARLIFWFEEEPPKAEPKVEEPSKAEEPPKAEPKVEEPSKAEVPPKAEPKVEEPSKAEVPPKAEKKN